MIDPTALKKAFSFTSYDLETNQNRQVTPSQLERIKKAHSFNVVVSIVVMIVFFGGISLVFNFAGQSLLSVGTIILTIVICVALYRQGERAKVRLNDLQVEQVKGAMTLKKFRTPRSKRGSRNEQFVTTNDGFSYRLHVGGIEFVVDGAAYELLKDVEAPITIYYYRWHMPNILSVEFEAP